MKFLIIPPIEQYPEKLTFRVYDIPDICWVRVKDGEIIENPPEEGDDDEYDDFDNIVQMANEGASDEEAEMGEFDRLVFHVKKFFLGEKSPNLISVFFCTVWSRDAES